MRNGSPTPSSALIKDTDFESTGAWSSARDFSGFHRLAQLAAQLGQCACGVVFDMNALTAAHKTLPFGTRVRVFNPATGQQVVVRINDRGPFTGGRIIDLSRAAAERIGLIRAGVAPVVLYAP